MNRSYKIIWNHAKQLWVAVSEISKAHGKSKSQTRKINLRHPVLTTLLAGTLGLASLPVMAAVYWNVTTGDWSTATNWDTNAVPNGGSYVFIDNGGTAQITSSAESVEGKIGYTAGNTGTVSVEGSGSSWTNGGSLIVGEYGSGTLTISDGGAVINNYGTIGSGKDSTGIVTVEGTGSNWENKDSLKVGSSSTGTLTISDGASVSNTSYGYIGFNSIGTGTVTVEGNSSSWTSSTGLVVGYLGTGTLTISDGAEVNVNSGAGTSYIAYNNGSNGTLNIGAAEGGSAVAAGTLNTGTIQFGYTALYGGDGTLIFNHTDNNYTFSADIVDVVSGSTTAGTHTIKLLAGSTRFTGSLSDFAGTMTVNGGTLSISASDTLSLGGDYSQTSGTLKIGVTDDTTYGKLVVTGTATLASNANITIDVTDTNFNFTTSAMADIISAGTLNSDGTFNVTDNSILFDFTAEKDGDTVDLKLTAAETETTNTNTTSTAVLRSVNNTQNHSATGAAKVLDDLAEDFTGGTTGNDDMDTMMRELGKLTTESQVSQAVSDTLPLLVSGTTPVITNNMHNTNRVIQTRQAGLSGQSSGEGFITDKHLWLKPIGSWSKQQKRNGVSGYDADSYGVVGGIDGELNDSTTLGFAVSYINTDVEGKGSASGSRADIDAYQAIVYGSHDLANNDIELNWQADVGINKNEGKRHISFMNRTAKADYDSYTAHIGVGAAKSITVNDTTTIVPSIRADYTYIKEESYSETGAGALNLNVGSNSSDELIVMAQSQLNHQVTEQTRLTANAGIGYDLLNDTNSLTASYSGGGAAFTTEGIDPSPWLARVGAGVTHQINDITEITAHYDLEGRSDFINQTASVKVRWAF